MLATVMEAISRAALVMRRIWRLAILPSLLAWTTLPSQAILFDVNTTYTVNVGGGPVTYTGLDAARAFANEAAFAAVGQMKYTMKYPANAAAYGPYNATGTLIADASGNQWVLTAAHNWNATIKSMNFNFQKINYSVDGSGTVTNTTYQASMSSLIQHPNWNNTYGDVGVSQGWDVALFRLTKTVAGITPATLYTSSNEYGQTGYTVGFGRLGTGTVATYDNTYQYKLAMANVIDRVTAQNAPTNNISYTGGLLVSDFDSGSGLANTLVLEGLPTPPGYPPATELNPAGVITGTTSSSAQLAGEGGTAKGDSGGPTFFNDGGTYKIAGITSWGVNPANFYNAEAGLYGDLTYMTRVSQQVTWINAVMAAAHNYNLSGNQTVNTSLTGPGGLYQSGFGRLVLSGTNDYTGGTVISGGTLEVANRFALGTGEVTVADGGLILDAGIDVPNAITIAGSAATFTHNVLTGDALASTISSSIGGTDTTATILSGTASSDGSIVSEFHDISIAHNDGIRISDVFSLSGVPVISGLERDAFTLELFSLTPVDDSSFIAWLDSNDTWVNAVNGNIGASTPTFVAGAWNAAYGLGTYGVDTANNTVWAVLNHNSDFAVVPEPGAFTLAFLGLGILLVCRGRLLKRCC